MVNDFPAQNTLEVWLQREKDSIARAESCVNESALVGSFGMDVSFEVDAFSVEYSVEDLGFLVTGTE